MSMVKKHELEDVFTTVSCDTKPLSFYLYKKNHHDDAPKNNRLLDELKQDEVASWCYKVLEFLTSQLEIYTQLYQNDRANIEVDLALNQPHDINFNNQLNHENYCRNTFSLKYAIDFYTQFSLELRKRLLPKEDTNTPKEDTDKSKLAARQIIQNFNVHHIYLHEPQYYVFIGYIEGVFRDSVIEALNKTDCEMCTLIQSNQEILAKFYREINRVWKKATKKSKTPRIIDITGTTLDDLASQLRGKLQADFKNHVLKTEEIGSHITQRFIKEGTYTHWQGAFGELAQCLHEKRLNTDITQDIQKDILGIAEKTLDAISSSIASYDGFYGSTGSSSGWDRRVVYEGVKAPYLMLDCDKNVQIKITSREELFIAIQGRTSTRYGYAKNFKQGPHTLARIFGFTARRRHFFNKVDRSCKLAQPIDVMKMPYERRSKWFYYLLDFELLNGDEDVNGIESIGQNTIIRIGGEEVLLPGINGDMKNTYLRKLFQLKEGLLHSTSHEFWDLIYGQVLSDLHPYATSYQLDGTGTEGGGEADAIARVIGIASINIQDVEKLVQLNEIYPINYNAPGEILRSLANHSQTSIDLMVEMKERNLLKDESKHCILLDVLSSLPTYQSYVNRVNTGNKPQNLELSDFLNKLKIAACLKYILPTHDSLQVWSVNNKNKGLVDTNGFDQFISLFTKFHSEAYEEPANVMHEEVPGAMLEDAPTKIIQERVDNSVDHFLIFVVNSIVCNLKLLGMTFDEEAVKLVIERVVRAYSESTQDVSSYELHGEYTRRISQIWNKYLTTQIRISRISPNDMQQEPLP